MPQPLQKPKTYSYGAVVKPYPKVARPQLPKKKKTQKKLKKVNPFAFLFLLVILGLFAYYVVPVVYVKYFEPLVLNPVKNRAIEPRAKDFMSPHLNYMFNSQLFGENLLVSTNEASKAIVAPVVSGEFTQLKSDLLNLFKKYPKFQPSLFVWEYSTAKSVDINAQSSYPSASIIKLPILFELFRKIERSEIDGTNSTYLDKKLLYDYIHATEGSGKLQYSKQGVEHSIDYLARIMITQSDNSSTNMLLEEIGGIGAFNSSMRSLGLKEVRINDRLPDLAGTNRISAKEIGTLLYNIDNPKFLSDTSSTIIKEYMANVHNRSLLQAGLPKEALLIHKTGDIGTMLGDAGIVYAQNGKKYIVAILIKRPHNDYTARTIIQEASKMIYNHINSL